jgi:hypothetical protein
VDENNKYLLKNNELKWKFENSSKKPENIEKMQKEA